MFYLLFPMRNVTNIAEEMYEYILRIAFVFGLLPFGLVSNKSLIFESLKIAAYSRHSVS